jgi:serine/threonine protein kinase
MNYSAKPAAYPTKICFVGYDFPMASPIRRSIEPVGLYFPQGGGGCGTWGAMSINAPNDSSGGTESTDRTLLRTPRGSDPIGPGTRLLNGKFELRERLGDGGMGVVYEAVDLDAARLDDPNARIAIKVLSEAIQSIPEAVLALQRESSRARRLAHPNIVRVYEFYQDGNACFISMELLSGRSWDRLFRDRPGGMPFERALPLINQLCSGLEYAHAQGVVHSDLKPANVFLTDDNVVKVLDFGIATRMRSSDPQSRDTLYNPRRLGAMSASHACLELWHGLDADPRDDVYSLACIVYELLSGRHPLGHLTAAEAFERGFVPQPIKSLSRARNAALLQALALQRKDRTASVEEFRMHLCGVKRVPSRHSAQLSVAATMVVVCGGIAYLLIAHPPSAPPSVPVRSGSAAPARDPDIPSSAALPRALDEPSAFAAANRPQTNASRLSSEQRSPQQTIRSACGAGDERRLLARAIQLGLQAKVELTLAADSSTRQQAASTLRLDTACLDALARSGISNPNAVALRRDATQLLGGAD